jgi:hypothetical protein
VHPVMLSIAGIRKFVASSYEATRWPGGSFAPPFTRPPPMIPAAARALVQAVAQTRGGPRCVWHTVRTHAEGMGCGSSQGALRAAVLEGNATKVETITARGGGELNRLEPHGPATRVPCPSSLPVKDIHNCTALFGEGVSSRCEAAG